MAKPVKRPKKRKRSQRPSPLTPLSNEPDVNPNATLDPGASLEGTIQNWMGPESTNAPSVGQDDEDRGYAAGGVELLQRFLGGRVILRPKSVFLLLTICWFCLISWLFLQDNEADRLSTQAGMKWFWTKAAIYSAFYILVSVIVWLSSLSGRRLRG